MIYSSHDLRINNNNCHRGFENYKNLNQRGRTMKESDKNCDCLTQEEINYTKTNLAHLSHDEILTKLKAALQAAISVEQATIPIYLYSYYSINRAKKSGENIRPQDVFANKAGATIMSVVVEEMLHMSLSCNILSALGESPELYLKSPASYPTPLPYHKLKGAQGPEGKKDEDVLIPLAKFSYEQLWHFLQIELPEPSGAMPEDNNWQTIGQFYSYIRCLICSKQITDDDFKEGGKNAHEQQIQHYNYSPNNIDTVSAKGKFNSWGIPDGQQPESSSIKNYNSASDAAKYSNQADSHEGKYQLISIKSKQEALSAILTICHQGEGSNFEKWDDDSKKELSHYYKFLTLQAQMEQYIGHVEQLEKKNPKPPKPIKPTVSTLELEKIVSNYPDNPTSINYLNSYQQAPQTRVNYQPLNDFCNGIYQYMFILTETIYKVPSNKQKVFFNKAMHKSMIWILDKVVQTMRGYDIGNGEFLAPSFENINLGHRKDAYSNLLALGTALKELPYYSNISYYIGLVESLPDVSKFWGEEAGPGQPVPKPYKYANAPAFPASPPASKHLPPGLPLHACMGLNSCKGSDRFGLKGHEDPDNKGQYIVNDCAGQGYCSTTVDHNCHVLNECKSQGGCGLYGTATEMENPGNNDCQSLGSCATPINAERFSTNGKNQGKSVWKRARKVFEDNYADNAKVLREKGVDVATELGNVPGPFADTGPAYLWISDDNEERGNMTACGASGMSGAGGCV